MPIQLDKNLSINNSELVFSYAKSSGPGGQHVNTTESQAVLKWNLKNTKSIKGAYKLLLLDKLSKSLNKEGDLVITSQKFRYRKRNEQDCIDKLVNLLNKSLYIPKKRKKTKPSKSAVKKRLDGKKKRSDIKKMRKKPID